jgi:5-methylcytosine-specific restriction endonuclease McrA
MRTLLLDNTYFPVKVINWQKAIILLVSGRAEVVEEYSNIAIRSVSCSLRLPRVLRLFSRHRSAFNVRFTRHNLYWRDQNTCQYCTKKFSTSELTFDHIVPVSKGGETSWTNVVAACASCNTKKANKTPEEAGLKLLKTPRVPNWSPYLCLRLKQDDPDEWSTWFPGSLATG